MAYYARDLITRAWFLSGIVSRNLQTPTGDQITDGLQLLNSFLDFKQIEVDLVPYWNYIELDLIPNEEYYYLPYVSQIETATFNIGTVRYPMNSTTRTNYFGSPRVDNVSSLPFSWNYNRELGGGTLSLYFKPAEAYKLKLMVNLFLVDVKLDTDLTDISRNVPYRFIQGSNQGYDTSYIEYLRYGLAKLMCSEYGVQFNPESEKILKGYERKLMYLSPPDLSMKKATILASDRLNGLNFGDCNIGRGWRPA